MPLLFSSKVFQQTKKNVESLSKKVFNFKKSFKSHQKHLLEHVYTPDKGVQGRLFAHGRHSKSW
jgi:hypothetical protein